VAEGNRAALPRAAASATERTQNERSYLRGEKKIPFFRSRVVWDHRPLQLLRQPHARPPKLRFFLLARHLRRMLGPAWPRFAWGGGSPAPVGSSPRGPARPCLRAAAPLPAAPGGSRTRQGVSHGAGSAPWRGLMWGRRPRCFGRGPAEPEAGGGERKPGFVTNVPSPDPAETARVGGRTGESGELVQRRRGSGSYCKRGTQEGFQEADEFCI